MEWHDCRAERFNSAQRRRLSYFACFKTTKKTHTELEYIRKGNAIHIDVCVCGSTAVYIERKNRRGKTFAVATAQLNRQLGSVYTLALAPLVVSQRISISGRQCYL
jgi:hypothetical protein